MKIKIEAGKATMIGELNNSKTAKLIWSALPINGTVNTWGDEIYFTIPVTTQIENPKTIVELGDIGYWPDGRAFCIFFGPTPISRGNTIKPASAVCVVGKVIGDPSEFKKVSDGEVITLSKVEANL
ncbi:MAG: cyclophilin-like fold protein [bacterium]|nr:cyclophilin-like fold protein [bacterium]